MSTPWMTYRQIRPGKGLLNPEAQGVDGETKITLDHNYQVTAGGEETKAPTPSETPYASPSTATRRCGIELPISRPTPRRESGSSVMPGGVIDVKTGDLLQPSPNPLHDLPPS